MRGAAAVHLSSNTLVGSEEREVTMRARELALELLKAGARMVVITFGAEGTIRRGELGLVVPGRPANVISTIGAGDVLTGVLPARLATSGFHPAGVAASLREAVVESSLACERWGALE
jgi:sugar/nucleoside kinase (ribokinase family)